MPEEQLFTEHAWDWILNEILISLKPYLDVELDVVIEETLFVVTKDAKESMQSYVTRKINKRRELTSALGQSKEECKNCGQATSVPLDLPDEIWSYLLRRGANLTEDQRKMLHSWDSGTFSGKRVMELLLRIDRTDALVAQTVAAPKDTYKPAYLAGSVGERQPSSDDQPSQSVIPPYVSNFFEGNDYEEAEEDDDEFDQDLYDDDGAPLTDSAGETLIPIDLDKEYDEDEAVYMLAFAGTYREVRGKIQATKVGRDQRIR